VAQFGGNDEFVFQNVSEAPYHGVVVAVGRHMIIQRDGQCLAQFTQDALYSSLYELKVLE
jgi:hypothetical protein